MKNFVGKLTKVLGFTLKKTNQSTDYVSTERISITIIHKFNPLKMKRRLLYLKTSSYRAVNTFHLGYKNQSVYAVSGTSRCLFSDKYKTHKYSVGRIYKC
jgi:hypothetical protein